MSEEEAQFVRYLIENGTRYKSPWVAAAAAAALLNPQFTFLLFFPSNLVMTVEPLVFEHKGHKGVQLQTMGFALLLSPSQQP